MKQSELKVGDRVVLTHVIESDTHIGLKVGSVGTLMEACECPFVNFDSIGNDEWAIKEERLEPYTDASIKELIEAGTDFYISTSNNNSDICDYLESLGLSVWLDCDTECTTALFLRIHGNGNKFFESDDRMKKYRLKTLYLGQYQQELDAFIQKRDSKHFSSQPELWRWLVDGNEVIGMIGGDIYSFIDNELYRNGSVPLRCDFSHYRNYEKHIKPLAPSTPQWHDNIGKGKLCRVWYNNDIADDHRSAELIVNIRDGKFIDDYGRKWDNAEILPREEALQYIGDE